MLSKTQIINNLRECRATDVALAINSGIITMYELSKSGGLTPLMRKRIEEALEELKDNSNVSSSEESMSTNQKDEALIQSNEGDIGEEDFPEVIELSEHGNKQGNDGIEDLPSSNNYRYAPYSANPFSLKGKLKRKGYVISVAIYFVWTSFLMFSLSMVSQSDKNIPLLAVALLLSIPMTWSIIAQSTKRCHDVGKSGWFQLIPFYWVYLSFAKSK